MNKKKKKKIRRSCVLKEVRGYLERLFGQF